MGLERGNGGTGTRGGIGVIGMLGCEMEWLSPQQGEFLPPSLTGGSTSQLIWQLVARLMLVLMGSLM